VTCLRWVPSAARLILMKTTNENYLIGNNTAADLRDFYPAIKASLEANGTLPEELADLFTVRKVSNPDGSPRYMIEAA